MKSHLSEGESTQGSAHGKTVRIGPLLIVALLCGAAPEPLSAQQDRPNVALSSLDEVFVSTTSFKHTDVCILSASRLENVVRIKLDPTRLRVAESRSERTSQSRRGAVVVDVNTFTPDDPDVCRANVQLVLIRRMAVEGTQIVGLATAFTCSYVIQVANSAFEDGVVRATENCTEKLLADWLRVNPKASN